MSKYIVALTLLLLALSPANTFGVTNPSLEMNFTKTGYYTNEVAILAIKVTNLVATSYPVDIYIDNTRSDGYKIATIDLANRVPTYTYGHSIDLGNHGILKEGGDYFNIFMCKSGTKCSLQDRSVRANIIAATNLHILFPQNTPTADLKINGKDVLASVKRGEKLNITWKSTDSTSCAASGNYLPDIEKGVWGDTSPRDKTTSDGIIRYYSNLKPKGSAKVYASPTVNGSTWVTVRISCDNGSSLSPNATDEITFQILETTASTYTQAASNPQLNITNPKAGQVWKYGKKHSIKWTSKKLTESIDLTLHSQPEGIICNLGTVARNKKMYTFTPQTNYQCESGKYLEPGQYMLEITSGSAVSQRSFSIK